MNSPYLTMAAIAASLFVVLVVLSTYVLPYLASVNAAFSALAR